MKIYFIGNRVETEVQETHRLFPTVYIKGRKTYSNAFILNELFKQKGWFEKTKVDSFPQNLFDKTKIESFEGKFVGNTQRTVAVHFASLEEANQYIQDKYLCEHNEPSSYNVITPSNYTSPKFQWMPIVYEIEISKNVKLPLEIVQFQTSKYRYEYYKFTDEIISQVKINSATIGEIQYDLDIQLSDFPQFSLDEFISSYKAQYESEFFTNPWSQMNKLIKSNELRDMSDIYDYAYTHPKSRTAQVLQKMIQRNTNLLTNTIIDSPNEIIIRPKR